MSKDTRVCHAPGDKCPGCPHYYGKADECSYKGAAKEIARLERENAELRHDNKDLRCRNRNLANSIAYEADRADAAWEKLETLERELRGDARQQWDAAKANTYEDAADRIKALREGK